MTEEQITKMFEERWRFKVESVMANHQERQPITYEVLRSYCQDFFEAGILIAESPVCINSVDTPITDPSFEQFWNLYDKKVGRPKCEKLWKKLSTKEKHNCLSYIPLYKLAQPDKQFRKNPETFLRNKSWYDEIIKRNNPEQQRNARLQQAAQVIAGYGEESR